MRALLQNNNPNEELQQLLAQKNKSKETKSLAEFYHRLQNIAREVLERELEDAAVALLTYIVGRRCGTNRIARCLY